MGGLLPWKPSAGNAPRHWPRLIPTGVSTFRRRIVHRRVPEIAEPVHICSLPHTATKKCISLHDLGGGLPDLHQPPFSVPGLERIDIALFDLSKLLIGAAKQFAIPVSRLMWYNCHTTLRCDSGSARPRASR
jgi:hypothetical protein